MTDYPTIWFLRHGETEWNLQKRIQGQLESDLTARGVQDARAQELLLGPILSLSPDCYVSPLSRAQQTAQIALGDVPYKTDPRLSEADAGEWQGLLRDDVRRNNPGLVAPDSPALDLFLKAPGGEGYEAFQARILSFLDDLTGPSVIIAHGLLGQVMRGVIRGLSWDETGTLPNEQACIYVLENGTEQVLR